MSQEAAESDGAGLMGGDEEGNVKSDGAGLMDGDEEGSVRV